MAVLTTQQLLALSQAFAKPFTSESRLRHYLSDLRRWEGGGLIRSFPYALESDGRPPVYWKLTRAGYRHLHGTSVCLPNRRYFDRIGTERHEHTLALGEFFVKTRVTVAQQGFTLVRYARENSVRLDVPERGQIRPDGCFTLRDPYGGVHHLVIELDNGTERVESTKTVESIQRKIEGYDRHQAQFDARDPQRYFVVLVTTRTSMRTKHMIDTARRCMQTPDRTVFLATELQKYLQSDNPFVQPCFIDNRGQHRPLVKVRKPTMTEQFSSSSVTSSFAMC